MFNFWLMQNRNKKENSQWPNHVRMDYVEIKEWTFNCRECSTIWLTLYNPTKCWWCPPKLFECDNITKDFEYAHDRTFDWSVTKWVRHSAERILWRKNNVSCTIGEFSEPTCSNWCIIIPLMALLFKSAGIECQVLASLY